MLDGLAQAQVIGAKIVPQLRDTVRLIHCKQRHARLRNGVKKALTAKALWRDVEQLIVSSATRVQALLLLLSRQGTIDERGGNATVLQRVHLVFHQRNEGRDDQGTAVLQQGRQLVAERLPTTSRHHSQDMLPLQQSADDRFLARAKVLVPKALVE